MDLTTGSLSSKCWARVNSVIVLVLSFLLIIEQVYDNPPRKSSRDYIVKMIGSFFVTMIVCSNCAAMALSEVRSDQPSFISITRPTPVVRNGSTAKTKPSCRIRWSFGIVEVQNFLWLFMQFMPNAVTGQIIDDVVAALTCFILHRSPNAA